MTPEARRDLAAARLKVTAVSIGPRILITHKSPLLSDFLWGPVGSLAQGITAERQAEGETGGGLRFEPINEASGEQRRGKTGVNGRKKREKDECGVLLFMQSIGQGLSASLIVWFYRREGLFKQTRSYANGVAPVPSWQHLLGGWTAGLWEGFWFFFSLPSFLFFSLPFLLMEEV